MASHIIGNRNSTPEASKSSLRPPSSSRTLGGSHQLRASADMSGFSSPLSGRNIRPASEVFYNQQSQGQNGGDDVDRAAQQWIADIDQYETTLEEMAAATLDQDFKDELSAIEQWFRVLSEAERTAALYALLQQTTQVQIRFFIQVLQQMAQSHPMSGVLSPANFGEKGNGMSDPFAGAGTASANTGSDPMSNRLSDAMSKLNVEGSRNSLGRPPPSPGNKRNSGLDPSRINAMFPDAAAAIAKKKAEFTQQTGNAPGSNRNSAAFGDRTSLVAPTISAPDTGKDNMAQPPASPWGQRAPEPQPPIARPKSSSGQQQPMGQFSQSAASNLRSPRPGMQSSGPSNVQNTTITAPDITDAPILSPYNLGNASWASMSNTPMVPNFNQQQTSGLPPQQNNNNNNTGGNQADMVANATAMKLAALSTVNNRIALDDARKYRRARSNDGQGKNSNTNQPPVSPGMPNPGIPGANLVMVNDQGQILNAQQIAALQAQQQAAMAGRRSRPNSPGMAMQGGGSLAPMNFASPQNNGFLAAYDTNSMVNNGLGGSLGLNQFGAPGTHEGYLSDHSEINRGRSPRGRRGSSKPPEDPTDPNLLQDIPSWLRSLRLHKYTDNLKDLKWTELIELDDKGLEERGVNALGARNKMLKVSFL